MVEALDPSEQLIKLGLLEYFIITFLCSLQLNNIPAPGFLQ